jgi:hypothetical protein
MPRPSRSAGQNPPMPSSHPSNASATVHSTHTQNVHRNFGIGTLDPIEQVFAKLKNTLRKMARRTVDALWDAIGIALDDFPPQECLNYFRNAGYGST